MSAKYAPYDRPAKLVKLVKLVKYVKGARIIP